MCSWTNTFANNNPTGRIYIFKSKHCHIKKRMEYPIKQTRCAFNRQRQPAIHGDWRLADWCEFIHILAFLYPSPPGLSPFPIRLRSMHTKYSA